MGGGEGGGEGECGRWERGEGEGGGEGECGRWERGEGEGGGEDVPDRSGVWLPGDQTKKLVTLRTPTCPGGVSEGTEFSVPVWGARGTWRGRSREKGRGLFDSRPAAADYD